MAPSVVTEDYYKILEVDQHATLEVIIRSYRKLALKLHPDRNSRADATKSFQLLASAYEALSDDSERRAYDLIYPSIKQGHLSSRSAPNPNSSSAFKSQSETPSEAAQIAAIRKSKQERATRWETEKKILESSIFEMERDMRRLENEITGMNIIVAAEAAAEASKNSWTAWILSPIYKRAEETEAEKAHKDRERQERKIERDMKDRRLDKKKEDLKAKQKILRTSEIEVRTADSRDEALIYSIQKRIRAREELQKQERERAEREKWEAAMRRQREQREREERQRREREVEEALRRQNAREAAERTRREEILRRQRIFEEEQRKQQERCANRSFTESGSEWTTRASCRHDGWWPKVQGRTPCPECRDVWTYLLQCPDCEMKACPKCQAAVRPKRRTGRKGARATGTDGNLYFDWD